MVLTMPLPTSEFMVTHNFPPFVGWKGEISNLILFLYAKYSTITIVVGPTRLGNNVNGIQYVNGKDTIPHHNLPRTLMSKGHSDVLVCIMTYS